MKYFEGLEKRSGKGRGAKPVRSGKPLPFHGRFGVQLGGTFSSE